MSDHADINERQQWNAFKKAYRKSHPHEKRDTKYYEYLRKLYRDRNEPNLKPWLKMSSSLTEQELIDLARTPMIEEVQTPINVSKKVVTERINQEMANCSQNVQQLRDYLEYLRHQSNCPPDIIASIQQEIYKLTLI